MLEALFRDLRYALRRLGARPGFTAVAVVSLALGIGANTTVFSLLDGLLLSEPPYDDLHELVEIYPTLDGVVNLNALSRPELEDVREGTREVFTGIAATSVTIVQRNLDADSVALAAEVVTPEYFDLLGLEPVLGRGFLPNEGADEPGAHPVVVIAHDYWQSAFGGDPGAVGRTIRLNGSPYTIVGVADPETPPMIPGFDTSIWGPLSMVNQLNNVGGGDMIENRGGHYLFARGRLAPGATLAQAQAALDSVVARTHEEHGEQYADGWGLLAKPTAEVGIHPLLDRVMIPAGAVLLVVVLMVLLIACVNLVSFLLAQMADRRKEIATRLALGAGRGSLVRQLLAETALLSLGGGLAGVVLAFWGLDLLGRLEPPTPFPLDMSMSPDGPVLAISLALALAAGLLFGLLPALNSSKPDLSSALKSEALAGGSPKRWSLRNLLVVGQVAVSLFLLVASGLFLRSLQAAQSVDPGFGREPTAIVWLGLQEERYDEGTAREWFRRLEEEAEALPGVEAVGLVDNLALGGVSFNQRTVNVDSVVVDGGYFEAAGVPILAGRAFGPQDRPDGPPVAIVSQAFAERFFPGEDPIGRELIRPSGARLRIVGVARDTKVRSIAEGPTPYLYMPLSQTGRHQLQLLARTEAAPLAVGRRIAELARERDADVMVLDVKTVDEHLGFMLFPFRFGGLLLSVLGGLALVLATVGLYGVVSYAVAARRREVGIRMSLGAQAGEMVRMMMRGGMRLVAVGAVLGLVLAFLGAGALSGLLFGVDPLDLPTFGAVTALLVLVAAAASLVPALRASRVDPVETLRSE